MSILIIRGPDDPGGHGRTPLSPSLHGHVVASLVDRAASAGKVLSLRQCRSDKELIEVLHSLQGSPPEILLIDPGAGIGNPGVCDALRQVKVPFVEVHDDTAIALEPELRAAPANRIGVVHGYLAQGYTLAMEMALEHLGCAECESEFHVGT